MFGSLLEDLCLISTILYLKAMFCRFWSNVLDCATTPWDFIFKYAINCQMKDVSKVVGALGGQLLGLQMEDMSSKSNVCGGFSMNN